MNYKRYKRNPVVNLPNREWPNKEIEKAPVWCSVDLRDGNQALIEPMTVEEKVEMFQLLVKLGFKEIEIGFPAASQIEFDFLRQLVDRKMIPDDVVVQLVDLLIAAAVLAGALHVGIDRNGSKAGKIHRVKGILHQLDIPEALEGVGGLEYVLAAEEKCTKEGAKLYLLLLRVGVGKLGKNGGFRQEAH